MPTALDLYVNGVPRPGRGLQSFSAMHALRRDARGATFRDLDNGEPAPGGPSPSWLGAIGYLILIEQIGEAVLRVDGPVMRPGFDRALAHFGPSALDGDQRKALRGLRNALAHDYGLVSRGRDQANGLPTGRYVFLLSPTVTGIVDVGPPWNLNWRAHPMRDTTKVGLVDVGDMVEAMVDRVQAEHAEHNVSTDLRGGLDELQARFLASAVL